MSYDKTNWQTGDTITAQKMNHIEEGIEQASVPADLVKIDNDSARRGQPYLFNPTAPLYSRLYFQDIRGTWVCFRGDTTYVTMYDRTKKLIKDVKTGDSVLGYDVNRREYCEAIVLENIKTGETSHFDTYVFENGATVDIYGGEGFVFTADNQLSLSVIGDLYNAHLRGDDRRWVLTHTEGAVARVIAKYDGLCNSKKERYSLQTSNGTFFANGLCHGNAAITLPGLFEGFELPVTIKSAFDQIMEKISAFDSALPDDKVEDATWLRKAELAKAIIVQNKAKLSATDYKAIKYAEGILDEEEWLPVKEERATARAVINKQEALLAGYNAQIASQTPILSEKTWVEKAGIWRECQAILDAHLEDFRAWAEEVNGAKAE